MSENSELINLIKKNLILSFQLLHLQTLLFKPFNNSLPFGPIPDSSHAYLIHPCSHALITLYPNSTLPFCLHSSLSIVGLGRLGLLVGEIFWCPQHSAGRLSRSLLQEMCD